MTREEAIKRLHKYAKYAYDIWNDGDADAEAFDMAIEALQQEPVKRGEWTYTLEEVAEILHDLFADNCACNYNGIDEWLPQSCKYADTECPDPKEKHGCWKQFLLQGAYVKGKDF